MSHCGMASMNGGAFCSARHVGFRIRGGVTVLRGRKDNEISADFVAPRARFELATLRLTAECSTIELPGNGQVRPLLYNTML